MRAPEEIQADIMDALTSVIDPELGVDVVNLGLINSVDLKDDGMVARMSRQARLLLGIH